jgi:uncharacterized membrane protein YdbT with pleckstrin-like domain
LCGLGYFRHIDPGEIVKSNLLDNIKQLSRLTKQPKMKPIGQPNESKQGSEMQAVITYPATVQPERATAGQPRQAKPSQAVNLGRFIKLALLGFAWSGIYFVVPWAWNWAVLAVPLLLLGLRAVFYWVDYACLSYRFDDPERIVWAYGVFARSSGSLEIFRVQNVSLHQTFLERLAGIGTITLETRDATNPMLRLVGMRQPEMLRASMTDYVQRARRLRGVQEAAVN